MRAMERGATTRSMRFAEAVRQLATATRAAGLVVPAFRSPPRVPGAKRTLRRLPGGPIVAVRVRGRALPDVLADMVEGVIVANALSAQAAANVRVALLQAVLEPSGSTRAA
jgi:hypothetical protein